MTPCTKHLLAGWHQDSSVRARAITPSNTSMSRRKRPVKSLSQRPLALSKNRWPLQRGARGQRHQGWDWGTCQCYRTHPNPWKCFLTTADREQPSADTVTYTNSQTHLSPFKSKKPRVHPYVRSQRDPKNCRMRQKQLSQPCARTSAESHVKLFSHIPEIKALEGFVQRLQPTDRNW